MAESCDNDDNNYYDVAMDNDYYNHVVKDMGDDEIDKLISRKTYTVLQESEIDKRQEEQISQISSTLCICKSLASKLLCNYKWNPLLLLDKCFANEAKPRAKAGLDTGKRSKALCGICFDSFPLDDSHFYPLNCGHLYCVTCWAEYITQSINNGPECLSLSCPSPECGTLVCRDMVDKLVGPAEKEKYDRFFLRSFIEKNMKTKWCPAPGCENAVEFELGSDVYDVTCLCSHKFCWNCLEEAHRPVDCKTASKWIRKNSSEAENTAWILANSKPCPKCNRAIDKTGGCNHITCIAPCNFDFCWQCLGDWTKHREEGYEFTTCSKFESDRIKGLYDEELTRRQKVKSYVEKYNRHFQLWLDNKKSLEKAVKDLEKMKTETLARLGKILNNESDTELEFILKGLVQIIDCRRVLKWSSVYGYYLPEDQPKKRAFFEFIQADAKANLERLHKCAEKGLSNFLDGRGYWIPRKPNQNRAHYITELVIKEETKEMKRKINRRRTLAFHEFRKKFLCLTQVTASYFEKFVIDLEKGLFEFETLGGTCGDDDDDDLNKSDYWGCSVCNFANPNTFAVCGMCNVGVPLVPYYS